MCSNHRQLEHMQLVLAHRQANLIPGLSQLCCFKYEKLGKAWSILSHAQLQGRHQVDVSNDIVDLHGLG